MWLRTDSPVRSAETAMGIRECVAHDYSEVEAFWTDWPPIVADTPSQH